LEKELRMITQERNELFKQKKKTSEGELTAEAANDILRLNQTIQELRTKLETAVAVEEEKRKLEIGELLIYQLKFIDWKMN